MGDLRLFDVPVVPGEGTRTDGQLSRDQRLTLRNRTSLANGRHPATGRPLLDEGWGYRCRDCLHAYPTGRSSRTYWKCALNRRGHTRGAATDLRLSWGACLLFRLDGEAQ